MKIFFRKKFQKSLKKQSLTIHNLVAEKSFLLLSNLNHPSLRVHFLKGKLLGLQSLDITSDIRVQFYVKEDICVFVNIGTHSELY